MFKISSLIFSITFMAQAIGHDYLIGKLRFNDQSDSYEIRGQNGAIIPYIINDKYHIPLRSLTNDFFTSLRQLDGRHFPEYFLRFDGKNINDKFISKKTPRVMSGTHRADGVLKKENYLYHINGQTFQFVKAYEVGGTKFNQDSINSYIGKKVSILYKKGNSGINLITAIVPALYTANETTNNRVSGDMKRIEALSFKQTIKKYLLKKIYSDHISKTADSFRHILMKRENTRVQAGDKALVITLSGRQGDSPGSIAGHLAAGVATVKNDLTLDMEIWNYYDMINEKFIMPGHNDFIDYFGNLTGGQSNYRPTYTLILYGFDTSLMKSMRDELGIDFYRMREESAAFGAFYNCATETVKALKAQGVSPKRAAKIPTHLFKKISTLALSPLTILSRPFTTHGRSLEYSLFADPTKFLPRASFDGYLKKLDKLNKKFNLTRIDYIFHSQLKSKRALGGAPSDSAMSTILGKIKAKEEL